MITANVNTNISYEVTISVFWATLWRSYAILFVILPLLVGVVLINGSMSENSSSTWELLTFVAFVSGAFASICGLKGALNVSHSGIILVPVNAKSVSNMLVKKP